MLTMYRLKMTTYKIRSIATETGCTFVRPVPAVRIGHSSNPDTATVVIIATLSGQSVDLDSAVHTVGHHKNKTPDESSGVLTR